MATMLRKQIRLAWSAGWRVRDRGEESHGKKSWRAGTLLGWAEGVEAVLAAS